MPYHPGRHGSRTKRSRHNNAATMANQRQAKRLYKTNSKEWRRIREEQLQKEPLCRHCTDAGVITAATDVDHINGHAATVEDNQPYNLQSLCHSCHSRKTATENDGFGNRSRQAET